MIDVNGTAISANTFSGSGSGLLSAYKRSRSAYRHVSHLPGKWKCKENWANNGFMVFWFRGKSEKKIHFRSNQKTLKFSEIFSKIKKFFKKVLAGQNASFWFWLFKTLISLIFFCHTNFVQKKIKRFCFENIVTEVLILESFLIKLKGFGETDTNHLRVAEAR